jgi:DNA-binding PadR family transcriptional regulator
MFLILASLAGEEHHGYAIMQEVEEETRGAIRLGPGTLYRSIKRLLDEGLIAESERRPDPDDDERRRYYRITGLGRRAAQAEAERLESVLRLAHRRALTPAGETSGGGA